MLKNYPNKTILQLPGLCKPGKTTVIRSLCFGWKTTARELFHFQMILQALTAKPLLIAAAVGTGAKIHVFLSLAFHGSHSFRCLFSFFFFVFHLLITDI